MFVQKLTERMEVLKNQVIQANGQVETLTKNLQQANLNMNQLHGHYNEVNFLLEEAKKEVEPPAPVAPVEPPALTDEPKDIENGHIVDESEKSDS